MFHRLGKEQILKDLKRKVVLLTGPRQVGKTWLAKKIMSYYKKPLYLNYDSFKDKKIIEEQSWLESSDLIIFDEIHKMDQWKNYIKGVFDERPSHRHILVTGSARLQQISFSGDSLAGRYFVHHLLPFSFFEISHLAKPISFKKFLIRGGFPEPLLLAKNNEEAERWRKQYMFSLLREDVADFKLIQNRKKMESLVYLLRESVGSPLSLNSLSQTLQVDYKTVSKYLSILEDLFIVFSIPAFSKRISRSLSKSKKIYFYDFGFINSLNKGARLENLVAIGLLKYCTFINETKPSQSLELNYLRTKDQREIDFLIAKKNSPLMMIEVKSKDMAFDKNLVYFHKKHGIPGKQISYAVKRPRQMKDQKIVSEDIESFLLLLDPTKNPKIPFSV